jgi:hypothetical protein
MYEDDPSKKLFSISCSLPFGDITGLELREVNISKEGEQSEPNVLEKKE